jgi:hypothetical protein
MKGEPRPIPVLSRQTLSLSRVIARGRRIRDIERLVRQYGGKASRWLKKSSPAFPVGDDLYEHHWYEHPGIGRRELKRKKVRRAWSSS